MLLIHHSLTVTTGAERKVGDRVNLEVDTMARYAARLVEAHEGGGVAIKIVGNLRAVQRLRDFESSNTRKICFPTMSTERSARYWTWPSTKLANSGGFGLKSPATPRRLSWQALPNMAKPSFGQGEGALLIVEARFHDDLADALLDGATSALDEAGATYDVVTVPGSLEIPAVITFALDGAAEGGHNYDGFVALGTVHPWRHLSFRHSRQ